MTLTREDLQAIKGIVDESIGNIKADVDELRTDIAKLDARATKIEVVQLENYLIPKVEEISAYQKSVFERYRNNADLFEEKIALLDSTAQTVRKHSEQIQELQRKQA